jgi:hypothetical protein
MLYFGKVKPLVDEAPYSAHDILIQCNTGTKPVERSELECLYLMNCNQRAYI